VSKEYYAAHREALCEKQREWNRANRDRIKENNRRYREANRETIPESKRAYYLANREQIKEKSRNNHWANREVRVEQCREYHLAHAERLGIKKRAWLEMNPISVSAASSRRARRERAAREYTAAKATRLRMPWSASEDCMVLASDGRTLVEKALMLGRTTSAVSARAKRLRAALRQMENAS
jgi:hypothetical protein